MDVSLVNIVNNAPVIIAEKPGSRLTLTRNVGSPLSRPVIQVSGDFQAVNFDGSFFPFAYLYLPGLFLGYSEVNRRNNIVPNYQFVNNSLSTGSSIWNEDWARSQLTKYRNKVGIAYHHFAFASSIFGLLPLMQQMNITIPVTTLCNSNDLSSPRNYPTLARTSATSATSALVMVRFFKLFDWKRCAVIYSDIGGDTDFYKPFLEYSAMHNITIINNETNRVIPLFAEDLDERMNRTIAEIMASTVRIIVMSHVAAYNVLVRMYDMGIRRGDFLICMAYDNFKGETEEDDFKLRNVAHGGLIFFEKYFMGAEGLFVKKTMMQLEGPYFLPVTCMFFDHAMLIAHAVGFMMSRGQHFEDGVELMNTIREIRFNGCLGVIKIEAGTNDRRAGDYSLMNVHVSEDFTTLEMVEGGIYSPTKARLFTLLPALQFPDGSNDTFPDSWPMSEKCPYLVKDIRDFPEGVAVSLGINGWFVGVSGVSALVTWRVWSSRPFTLMTEARSLSWDDTLAFLRLLIEFLQLSALGPDLGNAVLIKLQNLAVFRLEMFVNLSHNVYWLLAIAVYCWIAVLIIQSSIQFLNILGRLKATDCFQNWVWKLLFPFGNMVVYVPVCITVLDVFQCEQTTGGWTDSFLKRDCYQHCFVGEHITFLVVSIILLHIFLPVFTGTALYWQKQQVHLHVRASPFYMSVKSFTGLLLVALCVTLRSAHALAHAIVYVSLTAAYAGVTMVIRPYNYERVNLWTRLLAWAVCLYGVLGLVRVTVPEFSTKACLITLGVLYAVLGIVGFLIQVLVKKYRSLLTREKEDRYDIIKFAFTYGALAQTHLRNFRQKIARTRYASVEDSEHHEPQ